MLYILCKGLILKIEFKHFSFSENKRRANIRTKCESHFENESKFINSKYKNRQFFGKIITVSTLRKPLQNTLLSRKTGMISSKYSYCNSEVRHTPDTFST